MCGIVGHVGGRVDSDCEPWRLDEIRRSLFHRGPDGWGVYREQGVFLGHARLAVIDTSEAASQPMTSDCGRFVLVFNGEIYNFEEIRKALGSDHVWRTRSDTETLLAAFVRWGIACLSRVHGMFAFAVWDRQQRKLTLARDRLGVKPLYYFYHGSDFIFASRPRVLPFLLPRREFTPNRQALRLYLEAGYIPAPLAYHDGVRKLLPGHYLEYQDGRVSETAYWSLDHVAVDQHLSGSRESELLDELDSLIDRSVRWRMVSDVSVGAFLSGGIDSSLVAWRMAQYSSGRIRTFTIGFDDPSFDESGHAAAIAKHLGAEHTCEVLRSDDLLSLMPGFLRHYDEPFFDYSAFPVMAVSRLASRSVKVCLTGDGGDEAFGGYHYYGIASGIGHAYRLPTPLRSVLGHVMQRLPGSLRLLGHALERSSTAAAFAFVRSVIKDAANILAPSLVANTESLAQVFERRAARFPASLHAAEQAMRLDTVFTLPDDYLQKVDVGSMAFSLEARDPLLDHSIFEWAARLPLQWKMRAGTNKYLLRQLAYRHLPRDILDRPKMGFGVPMARWLREGLRSWGEELLADDAAMHELELQPHRVRELWRVHQEGRRSTHTTLWAVLVLMQFHRSQTRVAR